MRVHWVTVPQAVRARRAIRRGPRARAGPPASRTRWRSSTSCRCARTAGAPPPPPPPPTGGGRDWVAVAADP
jgi:hypothetical protein